jgi:hypothetical protein
MSEFGDEAENTCSHGVLRILTHTDRFAAQQPPPRSV